MDTTDRQRAGPPDTHVAVNFVGVTKRFASPDGGPYTAIADVDIAVGQGEFVSIVGPTGCGKSTLLNLAAGLLAADVGVVEIFGRPLDGLNRHGTYLFQQDVLLPWKSAEENVMLGLLFRQVDAAVARTQARELLARVGLSWFESTVTGQPLQYPLFRNQVTASILEIAPGGETGRHMHPNPTFVYVLEGTLTVDIEGHGQKVYTQGQSYLEAINHWHNGLNRGTSPVKVLVVFAGEEGKANLVRP